MPLHCDYLGSKLAAALGVIGGVIRGAADCDGGLSRAVTCAAYYGVGWRWITGADWHAMAACIFF